MKITKRQIKQIIKEELKIVKRKNNKLEEALKLEQDGYEFILVQGYENAMELGSKRDIEKLIAMLQEALGRDIESYPGFEGI